jgi:hypothetical protein
MEIHTYAQVAVPIYEPPALVELGEFGDDTHGGFGYKPDGAGGWAFFRDAI